MSIDAFSKHRREYNQGTLTEDAIESSPFKQFDLWYHELEQYLAKHEHKKEANAMFLATVSSGHDSDGLINNEQIHNAQIRNIQPSLRTLLLKNYGEEIGYVFFTNYQSRKGQELAQNPKASILFYWPELERQVRIEGTVTKIPAVDSDKYFYSRPALAQYAAMASKQSSTLASRTELEVEYAAVQKSNAKRPEHWGGYSLRPDYFEFWQGRSSRLHDRIVYVLKNQNWETSRLAP